MDKKAMLGMSTFVQYLIVIALIALLLFISIKWILPKLNIINFAFGF